MCRSPAACSCESSTTSASSIIPASPGSLSTTFASSGSLGSSSSAGSTSSPSSTATECSGSSSRVAAPQAAPSSAVAPDSSGSSSDASGSAGSGSRAQSWRTFSLVESMSRLLIGVLRDRAFEARALVVELRDRVAQLLTFRGEVARVLRRGLDLERDLLDDGQAVAVEARELARVVREDANRRQAEVGEDLVADPPLPRVGREAESEVRLHRVEPVRLQVVRAELVQKADPASL